MQHETPRSENHKATQSKKNTRKSALERSVAYTTGRRVKALILSYPWVTMSFLIQKYLKKMFFSGAERTCLPKKCADTTAFDLLCS